MVKGLTIGPAYVAPVSKYVMKQAKDVIGISSLDVSILQANESVGYGT